jgi:hypothetical protein
MNKLVDKIENYKIFNYILPGVVFVILLKYYVGINIYTENTFALIFIYYFIGLILSRVASIAISPSLEKINIIHKEDYKKYIEASKYDNKIEDMSGENNMYRNFIATFIALIVVKIVYFLSKGSINLDIILTIVFVLLTIIFILAYRKQNNYIIERIEHTLNKR